MILGGAERKGCSQGNKAAPAPQSVVSFLILLFDKELLPECILFLPELS